LPHKKKVWFIINPISGIEKKDFIPEIIKTELDATLFDFEIKYTTSKGHGFLIGKKPLKKK